MKTMNHHYNRRDFLRQCGLVTSGVILAPHTAVGKPEAPGKLFSAMGVAAPLARAAALKTLGAEFLTVGTSDLLAPDQAEDVFEKKLALLAVSPLPVLACNGFIRPKHLRCVGAEANHDPILEWSETAFRRLKKAGGKFIVFGSGGSRQLRDAWPKEKADAQFTALLLRKNTRSPWWWNNSGSPSAITSTTSEKARRSSVRPATRTSACWRISIT